MWSLLVPWQQITHKVVTLSSVCTNNIVVLDYDGQIQQIHQQLKTEQEMKNNMAKEIDNLRMIQEESKFII